MERRLFSRKPTHEVADLYLGEQLIDQYQVSCVSPGGVFVEGKLPAFLKTGVLVDLYFSVDRITTPHNKLLCMKGRIARVGNCGIGVKVFRKQLPLISA